ncbi:APSB_EMENI Anucleate primary sterigmata protein B [Aspergillus nidulans FGSC A4]|uniref:Anucleate primary sterigmata protein B n=1 Tax=Emericella nidulans (strain FGSC A4 / ATCC 38163 / CBS 112.46 / NRRL 194 / M139) TaxID=227321 RepID=APSB_EMENI|nr:protein apsB [Aspergillus nidulans FGSC A4]O60039.2 RecName: Full=Anucleate primary sterigmata protein B [Aspergillus nidulans FGSC A4]EAA62893.1 APSB_EMENI Anucleate primary sterigmata protein B [Aspergillus nidulans FGSC A4]CBF82712.1 TPA: Anucleate primary sterigmata protein B [Source:UniProtKB/Swiss-Prot;Acc:O60039] [Aspergillus nidulans FGSC A4]|eukprot:XP_661041.1 APSB_EMENI Anucleate primary sterigmata protein B [Aspergillus nidulans FGSC A4]
MTLKEQSSTIDRLSKENFDLKMRIHFLNEALNRRSEEGIKEMISENVELKSDKLKLQKDNQGLKRKIRDLEKQLKDQQSDKESMLNHDPEGGSDEEDRDHAQDEELLFLRERVETYELEIERLRSESIARESEKRRLAEMLKSLNDGRPTGSDSGAREERDMWKDMLDAETAAREQADEENKRLREELMRVRSEATYAIAPAAPLRSGHRNRGDSLVSHSAVSDRELYRNTAAGSSSSSTLVMEFELLKQENAELRREVSAQTSMLTSRNREKERLYQEIEELKLGQRRDRSIAGDSILDRSASRAQGRPSSSISDRTGQSPIDDAEREDWELRNGQLRDQVSALKLENQAIRQELEELDKAYSADVEQAEEDIQTLQQERDQAMQVAEERDAAFQELRAEAQEELDALGDELDQKIEECQRLTEDLRTQDDNLRALQAEMRSASEGIIRLEEDAQNNLQRYKAVQQELEQCNEEMESLEKSLYEANSKVQRLTVQIESSQNEIAFLREEQDGDKIKIGDLESELKTYRMSLQSEKDKTKELEGRLAEERYQREVVGSKEKQEVQRIMNELNREVSAAKEECRKLKKNLSAQEIETNTWKERLTDLENNLRETLGDLTGSRSSLIANIMKLQKELESTALELESTRSTLDEKETLLRNRDALLESHGLESRKLSELLERERQARRADKQSFEQALKSHHQASRTITQNNSRILELENARNQDRKRFTSLEQQFREQLNERNSMLLTIWKRLSGMCGPDWAHSNSLINGNLPSQEVIGNILFWPGFSRNLLLAVKTLENVISSFKTRVKDVERNLTKQYQTLEHAFSLRIKKLDRLEETTMNMRAQLQTRNQTGLSPELSKLRGENRLLKAELNLLQNHPRSRSTTAGVAGSPQSSTIDLAERGSLVRANTAAESPARSSIPQPAQMTNLAEPTGAVTRPRQFKPSDNHGNQEVWIKRLHELERRLKAEREARLLDRNGARRRLEERDAENKRLRAQLDRQRLRQGVSTETSTDDGGHGPPSEPTTGDEGYREREEEHSSSEGEGITVDIEV